jgi:Protein of unknown function, DUF547
VVTYFSKFSCVLIVGLMSGTGLTTIASATEYQNARPQNMPHHVGAIGVTNTNIAPKPDLNTRTIYSVFAPKPQTSDTKLDYTVWDAALQDSVVKMGPSLRSRAPKKKASILNNSRIVKGHKSPYRLEGSRVTFSYMPDKYIDTLTTYRKDLVSIANEQDLQTYSKKEQLAFWMNLHNVLLIENIAKEYPVRKPSRLKIGANGEKLHEAKLVVIQGVPLSLRDIRENIVYRNWSNPLVMYGFFRGDIGGPGIMNYAITSDNISYVLNLQAYEFVNSLRGFNAIFSTRNVSQIFQEAAPYYFENWPIDVERHIRQFADGKTLSDIEKNLPFKVAEYDQTVADLWGGTMSRQSNPGVSYDRYGNIQASNVPPIMYERARKIRQLRRKGLLKRNYTVTITDIDTTDPADPLENEKLQKTGE